MKPKTCRVCKEGTLQESTIVRTYYPNKQPVKVELIESRCEKCKAVSISSAQHSENLRRLAARKDEYGDQLMGEEYVAFRKRYGLTQRQASKIFGKGIIAFSRYENEETYPDASTRLLIELAIAQPEILKTLADKAGVEIPLWKQRAEDADCSRATTIESEDNEVNSKDSKAIPRVEDDWLALPPDWLALPPVASEPYNILYLSTDEHRVMHKSSSVGCIVPSFAQELMRCSAGLDIGHIWQTQGKPQRHVFSDELFSTFSESAATGEDSIGEAA